MGWQLESSKMSDYYGSSLLTLAAGREGSKGLFGPRARLDSPSSRLSVTTLDSSPASNLLFSLDVPVPNRIDKSSQGSSQIYSRGWILQEVVLSPFVISFEETQIYFRRAGIEKYESGCEVVIDSFWQALEEGKWTDLIEEYSRCALSQDQDRLPALSGLAHAYHA